MQIYLSGGAWWGSGKGVLEFKKLPKEDKVTVILGVRLDIVLQYSFLVTLRQYPDNAHPVRMTHCFPYLLPKGFQGSLGPSAPTFLSLANGEDIHELLPGPWMLFLG